MKQYKYLLFDLDGTITDSESGITRCVEYALNHFGIQVNDLRELSPFIGPPLMDYSKTFTILPMNRQPSPLPNTEKGMLSRVFWKMSYIRELKNYWHKSDKTAKPSYWPHPNRKYSPDAFWIILN